MEQVASSEARTACRLSCVISYYDLALRSYGIIRATSLGDSRTGESRSAYQNERLHAVKLRGLKCGQIPNSLLVNLDLS
jgi:hypothetical protein